MVLQIAYVGRFGGSRGCGDFNRRLERGRGLDAMNSILEQAEVITLSLDLFSSIFSSRLGIFSVARVRLSIFLPMTRKNWRACIT